MSVLTSKGNENDSMKSKFVNLIDPHDSVLLACQWTLVGLRRSNNSTRDVSRRRRSSSSFDQLSTCASEKNLLQVASMIDAFVGWKAPPIEPELSKIWIPYCPKDKQYRTQPSQVPWLPPNESYGESEHLVSLEYSIYFY